MNLKRSKLLLPLVVVLITLISIGVAGILQSTQKIETTGKIERPPPPIIPIPHPSPRPPPPEPTIKIEVYEDENYTKLLTKINWGIICPGAQSNSKIYVINKGDVGVQLSYMIEHWTPNNLQEYITLSWDYNGETLAPSNTPLVINLRIIVSNNCPEMDTFGFDFIILGS